jgi:hypothetical protein
MREREKSLATAALSFSVGSALILNMFKLAVGVFYYKTGIVNIISEKGRE